MSRGGCKPKLTISEQAEEIVVRMVRLANVNVRDWKVDRRDYLARELHDLELCQGFAMRCLVEGELEKRGELWFVPPAPGPGIAR